MYGAIVTPVDPFLVKCFETLGEKFNPGNFFKPLVRASVLAGNVLGLRTPCRGSLVRWDNAEDSDEQEEEEEAHSGSVCAFVIEIGLREKRAELAEVARTYIERVTLCVFTFDVTESDGAFAWSYSCYLRGESRPGTRTETARYEVVESVTNAVVTDNPLYLNPCIITSYEVVTH